MFGLARAARLAMVAAAISIGLLTIATPSQAQTTGSVRLHIVRVGLIVGVGGGDGVLHFRGHNYRLRVSGIGIGSLGIASADLIGTARNLTHPRAIVGTYGAAGAGGTFVGGGQVATLQNGNGVILELRGAQVGFQVSVGVGGMTISMR